jgi:uncharacterized protein (TIGR02421 family)
MKNSDIQKIRQLDEELILIIKDFLLLSSLSWPKDVMKKFLKNASQNKFKLPKVEYPQIDYEDKLSQLEKYIVKLGKDDQPAIKFLRETAQSYLDAYRILKAVGTSDVSQFSRKLYGSPKDKLTIYKRRNIDIAKYFLRVVSDYRFTISPEDKIYDASKFKKLLSRKVKDNISSSEDSISISVDSNITARATAGSNYVKIRKGERFSDSDLNQLFHHEVMIHTLTYINGRKQPILKTLGYNAPRTTATQEGLAVFAEYINMSIDLVRLKRLALRIVAIDMAENGADFIDLFKFFNKHGQDHEESYYSAMRIFRGGKPSGGIVFYKDNVYLKGLIEITAFMKRSMHEGMIHDISLLFCGKISITDISELNDFSNQGHIIDPAYMPSWAKQNNELAAHLAINDLTEKFNLREE